MPDDQMSLENVDETRKLVQSVYKRLSDAGRWKNDAELLRDDLMRKARREMKLPKEQAQRWAYAQLDRLYPVEVGENADSGDVTAVDGSSGSTRLSRAREADGTLSGLATMPADWPQLPPNASLAAEILWVQASRLDVVANQADGSILVDLSKADQPAPSKAAIGWLETSIRSFTKFCDIAAKATASIEDEQGDTRREKMSITDVRSMLAEMRDE